MQVERLGARVFAGTAEDRSTQAMRREIRLVWLGGALPFVVVLAILIRPLPGEVSSMTVAGSVAIPGEFFEAEAGVDRRGEHLALLTADGAAHALGLDAGAIQLTSVATDAGPFLPCDSTSLRWADVTTDGLLEIVVGGSQNSRLSPARSCVLRQEDARWRLQGVVPRPPVTPAGENTRELIASGRNLLLRPLWRPGSDDQRTRVTDAANGRTVARLEGLVRQIRDVDGDGTEDVLTWADGDPDALALLRLYVVRGKRFVCVWEQPVEYGDVVGRTGPYVECADLDGDGGAEVYVFEPRARRVRAWRWDEPEAVL